MIKDELVIKLSTLGNSSLGLSSQGRQLYEEIVKQIDLFTEIVLDFENIDLVTESFIYNSIGKSVNNNNNINLSKLLIVNANNNVKYVIRHTLKELLGNKYETLSINLKDG